MLRELDRLARQDRVRTKQAAGLAVKQFRLLPFSACDPAWRAGDAPGAQRRRAQGLRGQWYGLPRARLVGFVLQLGGALTTAAQLEANRPIAASAGRRPNRARHFGRYAIRLPD